MLRPEPEEGEIEMGKIPGSDVLTAIKRRDLAALRTMAEQASHDDGRNLLLLFADILECGLPNAGSYAETVIYVQNRGRGPLVCRGPLA